MTVYQVLVLANANAETAQAIVQAQGTTQILTGALLEVVSTLIPVVCLVLIFAPAWRRAFVPSFEVQKFGAWSLTATGLVLAGAALPLSSVAFVALLGLLMAGAAWVGSRQRFARTPSIGPLTEAKTKQIEDSLNALGRGTLPAMVVIGFVFLLGTDPWLPRENLTVDGDATVGYVLSADSDEVVYLEFSNKRVLRVPANDVTSREICEWRRGDGSVWDRSLADLLSESESYSACVREP